jgi:hypothetical protein
MCGSVKRRTQNSDDVCVIVLFREFCREKSIGIFGHHKKHAHTSGEVFDDMVTKNNNFGALSVVAQPSSVEFMDI